MIAVIDYKAGNLTSEMVKALRHLDARDVVVTQSPEVVRGADKIALPGVRHFQATQLLADLGLTRGRPRGDREWRAGRDAFPGRCVSLQWLFEGRPKPQEHRGLGRVYRESASTSLSAYRLDADLKSPHEGWNSLEDIRPDSRLLRGITDGSFGVFHPLRRAPVVQETARL